MNYKCNLVVWQKGQNPVLKSFYADNPDDLGEQQTEWMVKNNYETANFHLYEYDETKEEWVSKENGVFAPLPEFPEFAYIKPGMHENEKYGSLLRNTFIHIPSGRIIKMDETEDTLALMSATFVFVIHGKELRMVASVMKLRDDEMPMLIDGHKKELEQKLGEEIFSRFGPWFVNNMFSVFKIKNRNTDDMDD